MDLIIAAAILGGCIVGAAERWRRMGGLDRHYVHVDITVQDQVVEQPEPEEREYISPKNHHTQGSLGHGQFSPPDTQMRT